MKNYFLLLLTLASSVAFAQVEGRTIKWKATGVTDVLTGARTDHFKEVVSLPNKIDFYSQKGQVAASLTITGRNGAWNNQAVDGATTVKVEAGAQRGQVTFKRVGGRLLITLLLVEGNSRSIFDIDCSGFEVINP